jgi:hypothetical protein
MDVGDPGEVLPDVERVGDRDRIPDDEHAR